MQKAFLRLTTDYQDLNGTHIDHIHRVPTPLEFSRMVCISRPVLMSYAPRLGPCPDTRAWTDSCLERTMGANKISVAVTPDGRADDLIGGPDGAMYFVEPCNEEMTMKDFLCSLKSADNDAEVRYLQSQNGNLYNASFESTEFAPLRPNVPRDISWVSEALNRQADAVNLWIGNHRSVTSLHSDPYENLYTVVRGEKHFTLFPPTEGWLLEEHLYPHATYTRPNPDSPLTLTPSPSTQSKVPWSACDPNNPPSMTMSIKVTVRTNQTLYLPAGWYHHVRQSGEGGKEGICIAVNYWYDIEMRGMQWAWLSFLREGRKMIQDAQSEEGSADVTVDDP